MESAGRFLRGAILVGVACLSLFVAFDCSAQGEGIGGVLLRDVRVETDEEDWPEVLPMGGLVVFGDGRDWSVASRKDGRISVNFRILYKDGDRDIGGGWIPEDAVEVFTWSCPQNREDIGGTSVCYPFVRRGFFASNSDWNFRFVSEGKKLAESLGVELIEQFDPDHQLDPEAKVEEPVEGGSGSEVQGSHCTVDQILTMKSSGLTDDQVRAACG